ncbi:MAG TPA: formyltransferase family protein [Chitinophagaceae bacterium]
MRIALLTNSKLSVPAIDYLGSKNWLAGIGMPEREDRTEDADQIRHTCMHHRIPVTMFSRNDIAVNLERWIAELRADVVFVFTFPFKIPSSVLGKPANGFINFHFGLLPQYRGADAIFWQIRNREKEGGISVHKMNGEYDKGPLYLVSKIPIHSSDTYGIHLLNLSMAAVQAAQKTVELLGMDNFQVTEQDESFATYYHRPTLSDLVIDWEKPAPDIIALINAANPWNKGAVTFLNQYPIKIISASVITDANYFSGDNPPGAIVMADQNKGCFVRTGSGELVTLDILYCNDSFITGIQFVKLGITTGMQFGKLPETQVA